MSKFTTQLEASENFSDIFEIVKKSVKENLGRERAGQSYYFEKQTMSNNRLLTYSTYALNVI